MKKLSVFALSLFLSTSTAFADSPKDSSKEPDTRPPKAATNAASSTTLAEISAEIERLRQTLQLQQEQLQQLKEELAIRDLQLQQMRKAAASANSPTAGASATTTASDPSPTVAPRPSQSNFPDVPLTANSSNSPYATLNPGSAANPVPATSTPPTDDKPPLAIRFKGINITPGGFIAAESVSRQRALSDDINTQFNATPFGGNSVGKFQDLSLTARQTRLTLLADSKIGTTNVYGYFETDFLGAGVTSNNRQSNSYVFRERQLFARADFASGWAISGGQMWSLATENKVATVNRTEWLPAMIDPDYVVGFTWTRGYGLRVSKTFQNKLTFAVSAENPQATLGGRGFSTYTNTSATGTVTTYQNSFVFAPGAGGGLYNSADSTGYSLNHTPDFIAKIAFDPGYGHYELFGIVSTYENRIFPCAVVGSTAENYPTPADPVVLPCASSASLEPSTAGAHNNLSTGGAVGASAAVPLFAKRLDAGLKLFYGDGEGRYSSAQLPDTTLRPDGTIALVHDAHFLGRLEWHVTPKWDIYTYIGGEYAGRTSYTGYESVKVTNTPAIPGCGAAGQQPCPSGSGIIQPAYPALTTTSITLDGIGGYGSPFANNTGCSTEALPAATGEPGTGGTCAGDTRYLMESTLGFWNKIYQGEKGRVQWGIQYSYLFRNAWSGSDGLTGTTSIAPHAVNNMFFTSFRYYLP